MFLNLVPLRRDPFFAAFDQLRGPVAPRAAEPAPRVNGYQTDESYILVLEAVGLTTDQLDVKVENGGLTVQGKGGVELPQTLRALHRELPERTEFSRRFSFGEDANLDDVHAELKDGLLTVRVPRRKPEPRRIAVVAA